MPAPCFRAYNNATGALTGPPATQASANVAGTVRTMLQIAPATANNPIRITEWGYTLDTPPTTPCRIELVDTDTVFATGLTAHVAAGIQKVNVPAGSASSIQLGTALTGYNVAGAGAEGTVTTTRLLDYQYENGLYFKKQFPLGREPEIAIGKCLRIRVTPGAATAVNITCYIEWEE